MAGVSPATSKPRYQRFEGLALDQKLADADSEPWCGVQVIDLESGACVHWFRIDGGVAELYDLAVVPGVVRPMALSFATNELVGFITHDAEAPSSLAPVVPDHARQTRRALGTRGGQETGFTYDLQLRSRAMLDFHPWSLVRLPGISGPELVCLRDHLVDNAVKELGEFLDRVTVLSVRSKSSKSTYVSRAKGGILQRPRLPDTGRTAVPGELEFCGQAQVGHRNRSPSASTTSISGAFERVFVLGQ